MVVHPWISLTEEELQITYLITLGLVETIFDPVVDRVKMVLAGATTIKRDWLSNKVVNELVIFYGAVVGVGVGPVVATGVGAVAVAGTDGGQHEGNTSCRWCSAFLCVKCKKHDEDSIMYLKKISETVNELQKKRGVKGIVSKNVWHAYTPRA